MKKKALLVGINYQGSNFPLRGCINDVMMMNRMITDHYGFNVNSHKRMLTERSATAQNILERLEWLIDDAEPGDVLFFHYSGHGSQMIDTNYDDDIEPDGKDELICPIDINWRDKVVKDDDMKRIFDKLPPDVNLTVILDACHSGDGIDSNDHYMPFGQARTIIENDSPNRSRMIPMPEDIANRGYGLDLEIKPRQLQSNNSTGLLISGCQSHQTSADAWIHNKYIGACSFFLNHVLKQSKYDITYEQLVKKMNRYLKKYGYTQRPELNGNSKYFCHKFLEPLVK